MSPDRLRARPYIVASVMASMAMVAVEATIISTAMPQIAAQLGGLDLYSWVFSSFLLAQTAMTVVFGKLADVFGRKPVMLAGIAIFMLGSLLAGFAWSMPAMIAFRLIQGIGGGAIQPIGLTIIADYYPASERGRVQGFIASVWATAAVVGPLLGGLLIADLSWSWIFWINVPLGFAAAYGFQRYLLDESQTGAPHSAALGSTTTVPAPPRASVDYVGAVLFTIAIAALMVALTNDGTQNTGIGKQAWIALGVLVVSCALFALHEQRVQDPMVSFALWRRRPIAAANGATLLSGMALMGLTTFLPMYAQGVLRQTPVVAGLSLTMIMLGWPIGATTTARTFMRFGLRRMMVGGSVGMPLGAFLLVLLTPASSPVTAGIGSLVMGLGMGSISISCLVLIQEIVAPGQRASATASNIFSRSLGSTLGAAVFGAVLNFGLAHGSAAGAISQDQLKLALQAKTVALPGGDAVRHVLQHSLHLTFLAVFVISALVVVLVVLVPAADTARVRRAPKPGDIESLP